VSSWLGSIRKESHLGRKISVMKNLDLSKARYAAGIDMDVL
jgi:hypothetical protein